MAASVRACFALRCALGGAAPFQATGGGVVCGAVQTNLFQSVRHGSFFNKLTADALWKGVLADTNSSKKGRGKRSKRQPKKDLNRGQVIGEGKGGFLWPGLNAPVFVDGVPQNISRRGEEQQREKQAELARNRDEWEKRRKMRVKSMRGWTGNSWGGISLGAPDPGPNGETYEDFEARVIEVKNVSTMTAKEGRKRTVSCLVAVGNGNGAAGFALGKAAERMTALRKETHQALADRKQLNVVEFQGERGPLPLLMARPEGGARAEPEPDDLISDRRLHWADVRVKQGSKRSHWATVKHTIW
ncbi:hypothetical protein CRUP_026818 [Coryphaenoides rupestris]|nr:hypothetical protein CRUP_026818 [Coryphaenoides rupestris]